MAKIIITLLLLGVSTISAAFTTDAIVAKISAHLLKVYVAVPNGFGMGSAVVIAPDQVVTNCHVIADAQNVTVVVNDEKLPATALKADWHHDLCILKVSGLEAYHLPVAHIGSSEKLKYEQPVYSIGFANNSPRANATFGYVKGLYQLDDSVVVRASNTFRLGDSGGGVFDEDGNLVAIIAVKSPGKQAFYYNMSVEWVKKLMNAPEQNIITKSELPFWAEAPAKWPYFMKIVHPFKTGDWEKLSKIASEWAENEPQALEATFYQAVAEYGLKKTDFAELHLKQVVSMNQLHSGAMHYLGLIAEQSGKHAEALEMVAMLDHLQDRTAVSDLKVAMGIPD